jgi:hypothetical protein
VWDNSKATCELRCGSYTVFSDIRESAKIPDGFIILDARVFDMLHCSEDEEITLTIYSTEIPVCTEIHLDIISKRELKDQTVAHAISDRIDDFKEHFEGLILISGQTFELSELGISFLVRSMSPIDSTISAARVVWKELLKINLGATETQPSNLCIIAEVAAATQIADVALGSDDMTRHQAILHTLTVLENKMSGLSSDTRFVGYVFSDESLPFITFDSQTGEESEITSFDSPSIIEAFRKWVDTALDEFSKTPSNPGVALKLGIEMAQTLSADNGLPTILVLFSSGVYSAGQNPVKVTRKNIGDSDVRIIGVSVGRDSATDIIDAIAKEGNGLSLHLQSDEKVSSIVDTISEMMIGTG